jgi:hypothetical protein
MIPLTTVIAAVASAASGCGSNAPSQTTTAQTPAQGAFAFARCMRAHGVAGFPDPQVSTTSGQTEIRQAVGPQSVANAPVFKTAQAACQTLAPGERNGGPGSHGPGKQALLAFARCLRGRGITDFPDPNPQGRLTLEMVGAAGVDVHSPGFFAAARSCVGVTNGAITVAEVAALTHGSH